MPAIQRYCSHCGAANAAESQLCFACQHPLDTPEESEQAVLLNGRYRLLAQVGAGGFGGVYRAIDTAEAPRIVAVKEITLRSLSAQEAIEATDSFNREVRLLSALRHPNLPKIYDTFADPEHWYLVMDFIEGETLETYLKYKVSTALPLGEAFEIGLQLCTVLNYLHTRQPAIIFRDLKPSNVMRTSRGHISLIDFGIARHFTPGKPKDTVPFGSPGYAAPEQYGRAQTTPQADIYSLGVLLHQMLTGHDPAESPFRFAPLPLLITDSAELAELDTLIQRMVATEPGQRPNITEVQTTLQRLAQQERLKQAQQITRLNILSTPQPSLQVPRAPTGITRRQMLTAALSLGAVIAGVTGIGALCTLAGSPHPEVHGVVAIPPPSPGIAQKHLVYQRHTGPITALSWSPDGMMVASGSADKTVQVWRAADGALLYTYLGYDAPITSIAWATDEKNRIASSGMSDGTVQVWNALQDHTYLTFHSNGRVLALSWQEHSPWIVSGGTDREISVWNALTGEKCTTYAGHKGEVRAVEWMPGATSGNGQIVSGGADGTVQTWNAANGQQIFLYKGHRAGVNGLALLQYPSERQAVAIVSASDDKTARVWSPDAAVTSTIYRGHNAKVNALAALPYVPYYGPRVASASDDQTVQVWSIQGYHLLTYPEHHAPVKALAASPVDNRMVSGDENGLVHLWTIDHTAYQ